MNLSFTQGLARFQTDIYATPTFLQRNGDYIDLVVSPDPTIIIFAHKNATYLIQESKSITHAWGPFTSGSSKYLYWDLNLLDASLTRGITSYPILITSITPSTPMNDQHWFDISEHQMKVWNGNKWIEKVRVFAGTFSSNAIIQPVQLGSQVNLTGNFKAGNLILDSFNKPLRQSDGTFLTTTGELSIIDGGSTKVKFEAEIISGIATEYIPKFSFVQAQLNRRLSLARSTDWRTRISGLVIEDLYQTEVGNIICNGLIRNNQWNWDITSIGRPIFCGVTGEVTLTPPITGVSQICGFVYDLDSIILNIQKVTILDDVRNESVSHPPIIAPPPVANFITSITSGTAPLTVLFTSTSLNAPTIFNWYPQNIDIQGTSETLSYIYTTPGTYSPRLVVSNQNGQDEELKLNLITVITPDVNLNTNLNIQLNGPLQAKNSETFEISLLSSNTGRRAASNIIRTITVQDIQNNIVQISNVPTGTTQVRVGKATVITLPVLSLLTSGGFYTSSLNLYCSYIGDIKIIAEISSTERDGTLSNNVAILTIKIK